MDSKKIDRVVDTLNDVAESYLEKIDELNDEWDTIERDAHYENRSNTTEEYDRMHDIESLINIYEELNDKVVKAIESLSIVTHKFTKSGIDTFMDASYREVFKHLDNGSTPPDFLLVYGNQAIEIPSLADAFELIGSTLREVEEEL